METTLAVCSTKATREEIGIRFFQYPCTLVFPVVFVCPPLIAEYDFTQSSDLVSARIMGTEIRTDLTATRLERPKGMDTVMVAMEDTAVAGQLALAGQV